jgi:hypothetical protein
MEMQSMTLNVYAAPGSNFQQVGGDCPEGWLLMEGPRPEGEDASLYTATPEGTWIISEATQDRLARDREVAWVEAEMAVIADQLVKLEDEDPSALPGTSRQWRDYRIALRSWNDTNAVYPNYLFRPERPS